MKNLHSPLIIFCETERFFRSKRFFMEPFRQKASSMAWWSTFIFKSVLLRYLYICEAVTAAYEAIGFVVSRRAPHGPLWLTSPSLLLSYLRAVTLLHFREMGNNGGWLYVTSLWGTVGNTSLFHVFYIPSSFVLSLHSPTHIDTHTRFLCDVLFKGN